MYNLTLNERIDDLNVNPVFISTCIIIICIVEIIGNGNLIIMMVYERYAMDPQKRTVNNQLISYLCFVGIIQNLVCCPIISHRMLISPLGKSFNIYHHCAFLESSTVKKLPLRLRYMVSSVLTWRMQDFCQNSQIW